MKSQALAVLKPGCPACKDTKPQISKAQLKIVDADAHPSIVEKLGVEAFPDVVYKNSQGTVHHMPWPSQGIPTASNIVAWIKDMKRGRKNVGPMNNANRCVDCSNSVSPNIWGPPLWFVIHYVALMYPRRPSLEQRASAVRFFRELQPVLPCEQCRKHYLAELKSMDPRVFNTRKSLFTWTVDFHNRVSERTGSKQPKKSAKHWKLYYKNIAREAIKNLEPECNS